MISIPPRLQIQGRALVQHFEPTEALYYRFSASDFTIENNRIPVAAFRFPDFSVNRSLFSEPIDVLLPNWINWGIAQFFTRDIPATLPVSVPANMPAREITFRVEHDPIGAGHAYFATQGFENYAHCEIRHYENGERGLDDIPKSVKKAFRTKLSDAATSESILLEWMAPNE